MLKQFLNKVITSKSLSRQEAMEAMEKPEQQLITMNGSNGTKQIIMEHKFLIWAKNKKTGKSHIVNHSVMFEEEIEAAALKAYEDWHDADDRFEYSARLDQTII